LKKAELEEALDKHLAKNQTIYASEPSLSEYYKRLGPKSPVKKIAEKVSEMVKSDDEVATKKGRRKTVATTYVNTRLAMRRNILTTLQYRGRKRDIGFDQDSGQGIDATHFRHDSNQLPTLTCRGRGRV
jgi:hypothetical protein